MTKVPPKREESPAGWLTTTTLKFNRLDVQVNQNGKDPETGSHGDGGDVSEDVSVSEPGSTFRHQEQENKERAPLSLREGGGDIVMTPPSFCATEAVEMSPKLRPLALNCTWIRSPCRSAVALRAAADLGSKSTSSGGSEFV